MMGSQDGQSPLWCVVDLDGRVPAAHPLRPRYMSHRAVDDRAGVVTAVADPAAKLSDAPTAAKKHARPGGTRSR